MRNARNFRPLVLRTSVQQKLKFTEKMISCGWKTWLQGQESSNNILPPPLLCFYWVLAFSISLSLCIACNSLFRAVSCTWRIAQVRWMLEDQIKQHHINRWTTTALVISNTHDTSIYQLGTRWVDEDKKVSCKQNVQWILYNTDANLHMPIELIDLRMVMSRRVSARGWIGESMPTCMDVGWHCG